MTSLVVCDRAFYSGVIEVPDRVLGPAQGVVAVDLVEPGIEPITFYGEIVSRHTFTDVVPNIVIMIGR